MTNCYFAYVVSLVDPGETYKYGKAICDSTINETHCAKFFLLCPPSTKVSYPPSEVSLRTVQCSFKICFSVASNFNDIHVDRLKWDSSWIEPISRRFWKFYRPNSNPKRVSTISRYSIEDGIESLRCQLHHDRSPRVYGVHRSECPSSGQESTISDWWIARSCAFNSTRIHKYQSSLLHVYRLHELRPWRCA